VTADLTMGLHATVVTYNHFASRLESMNSLKELLIAFGLPGLVAIAILDSAGVPLPGGVDIVVIFLSWQTPQLFLLTSLLAATGSTIGCWLLYRVGRAGGRSVLARIPEAKKNWVEEKVQRNGILAVTVAMLGPPPFPTKIFILVSGVVGMDARRFIAAVFIGRLIRYGGTAFLAVQYGDSAIQILQEHSLTTGLGLVAIICLYMLGRRIRESPARSS